jgi:hypothetical protein
MDDNLGLMIYFNRANFPHSVQETDDGITQRYTYLFIGGYTVKLHNHYEDPKHRLKDGDEIALNYM